MTLSLNGLHAKHPTNLESLLVGPNGASAPSSSQTFDFFSFAGGTVAFGPQTTTFTDSSAAVNTTSAPAAASGPGSYGATTYTASPFFILPGTVQHATSQGAFTFNTGIKSGSGGGVYLNTDPNGAWSLYFDQTIHDTGNGANGGWCLNFIVNPVAGQGTTSHTGPAPGNHMVQGGTGSVSFSLKNNGDSSNKGSTGDPDQALSHAMTVVGTLPAGLTLGAVPTGSPWNCTANSTTAVTCTNSNSVAAGSSYTALTIPVNVAGDAASSVNVSGFTFSGAGMTAGAFTNESITINSAPVLGVVKTHVGTFTQGSVGQWNIVVSNNSGSAAGATDGSAVTVQDTLPSGYSVQSVATGAQWSCGATTQTTVNCTSNSVVAGQSAAFQTITVNANIPPGSATSVMNTAYAWGGGDLTHINQGTAASGSDTVTVVQVPASLSLTSGNSQTATVGTAFSSLFGVTVRDAGNATIGGGTVTFTAPSSGASGKFANNTNVTTAVANDSGVATSSAFSANSTAGSYSVQVSVGSITNTFSATNVAGPATQMSANPGTSPQATSVNTAFANALAVTVKDASNNPVSGFSVTFTAPGSGASGLFSNAQTSIAVGTNASGIAAVPFTANAIGGTYSVTATAQSLSAGPFMLTNLAPTLQSIAVTPASPSIAKGGTQQFTATGTYSDNSTQNITVPSHGPRQRPQQPQSPQADWQPALMSEPVRLAHRWEVKRARQR